MARTTDWTKRLIERIGEGPGWRVEYSKAGDPRALAPDGSTMVPLIDQAKDSRWRQNTLSALRRAGLDLYSEFKSESTRPKRERYAEKARVEPLRSVEPGMPEQMALPAEVPVSAQEWIVSDHARERAQARGVPLTEVLATVGAPTLTRPVDNESGRMLHQRGDLAVVVAPESKTVITVLPPVQGRVSSVATARAIERAEPGRNIVLAAPLPEPGEGWTKAAASKFAASLSEDFLLCRELGHQWRPWQAWWNEADRVFERALKCHRCRAQRWEKLSGAGRKVSISYVHPEGYLSSGHGRMTGEARDMLRLESVTRLVNSGPGKAGD